MDLILAKFKKEVKDFIYQQMWQLQDVDLKTMNEVLEIQADIVETVIDEYNAIVEEE